MFWEYIRILRDVRKNNPNVKFLLENVEMAANWERVLNHAVGVVGVHINSSLVSAQNRKRIYWSNIKTRQYDLFGAQITDIPLPEDRRLVLKDVLELSVDQRYYLSEAMWNWLQKHSIKTGNIIRIIEPHQKTHCVTATATSKCNLLTDYVIQTPQPYRIHDVNNRCSTIGQAHGMYEKHIEYNGTIRKLTPTECARLQTILDWYSWKPVSNTQQYRLCGNGWTVEVIKHILSFLKQPSNGQ